MARLVLAGFLGAPTVLVLVATPVARVAFSVLAFAAQRDRKYVAITLCVLAVLGVTLSGMQR